MPMSGFDTVYYWVGGREVGEWKPTSYRVIHAPDVPSLAFVIEKLERAGYVAVRGSTAIGPPEGPPLNSRFKALGL